MLLQGSVRIIMLTMEAKRRWITGMKAWEQPHLKWKQSTKGFNVIKSPSQNPERSDR